MRPLGEQSFEMYTDAGALAVQRLVAAVLWLALDDVTCEHVRAAVKLGFRQLAVEHAEVGDSAVRDAVHDYLTEAWGLTGTGWVFHFDDFERRRRCVVDWDVAPAPRDAHRRLAELERAEAELEAGRLRDQTLYPPTVNAFRRLNAGRVLRRDGSPASFFDGERDPTETFLRDAGSYAELSFAGRPVRLPWPEMLELVASLEAGCGAERLRERALALPGV